MNVNDHHNPLPLNEDREVLERLMQMGIPELRALVIELQEENIEDPDQQSMDRFIFALQQLIDNKIKIAAFNEKMEQSISKE